MDMIVESGRAADATQAGGLIYDGSLADLYSIFWRNLLLTVLTLGIFRFWAVTRNRRYLWAHMSFQGDRFEYTGRGGEKLRGFLVAMVLIGILWGLNIGVGLTGLPKQSPVRTVTALLYLGALLLLGQVAPFTAQRYRLSRTQWRALGGGMVGSAMGYGLRAFLYSVGNALTLFLLTPLRRMRLVERRIEASSFGNARLQFVREPGVAFAAFLGAWALRAVALLAWGALVGGATFVAVRNAQMHGAPPRPNLALLTPIVVASVLLFPSLNRLASSWYDAAVLRRVLQRLRYLDLRFSTQIRGRELFVLRLQNAAIVLVTAGLGAPVVRQRCARFVAARIQVTGAFDATRLQHESAPLPSQGEGLFDAFDVGFLY